MQKTFNQTEVKINPLKAALEKCKAAFKVTFVFAFFINLLMLVTPLYSLQVLDRVIGSGNLHTLLMLSMIITYWHKMNNNNCTVLNVRWLISCIDPQFYKFINKA